MSDPFYRAVYEKIQKAGGELLGYKTRAQMTEVMAQHDVVCVLSRSQDPCPLVVPEAMMSGCAVLASDRGGLPQLCHDPETGTDAGVLVNPDDFSAVLAALRSLVADRARLGEFKKRALQRSRALSWTRNVDCLEKLLQGTRGA
jgi:glycosyltransferase involved in cell wall biosynthesis